MGFLSIGSSRREARSIGYPWDVGSNCSKRLYLVGGDIAKRNASWRRSIMIVVVLGDELPEDGRADNGMDGVVSVERFGRMIKVGSVDDLWESKGGEMVEHDNKEEGS